MFGLAYGARWRPSVKQISLAEVSADETVEHWNGEGQFAVPGRVAKSALDQTISNRAERRWFLVQNP
jgi:hypothetical protein